MSFEAFLREQMKKHPSMQPQDVVKMCYQAAFGAEHLLLDLDVAKSYHEKEYAEVVATKDELYEQISDTVCRINLSAWKAQRTMAEIHQIQAADHRGRYGNEFGQRYTSRKDWKTEN
jgi:hypothetical protein